MDTRIYVMTHKEYTKPGEDIYYSLNVGGKLDNGLGYEKDNLGDNISHKNKNYSELTGVYYIWKNISCDIVGICHYRRYFIDKESFINREFIEDTLKDYDIIVPNSGNTSHENNAAHYKNLHIWKDMEICKAVTLEKYPEYERAFDLFLNTNLASLGNMMITKKEIFDSYCQWLFDILFEVEKRTDISGYDEFQGRIYGYLSERLFRIWLFMQEYKVKEVEVRLINPEDSENAIKVLELKNRMVQVILQNILNNYKNNNYYDLVKAPARNVDFNGKIPVWICWWQSDIPEIVRICIDSIKRNIPDDRAQIRLITFENAGEYLNFPVWILDKIKAGRISLTHLSDVLRMGLLYYYGGLWIDSTYFVTSPLPEYIFNEEFFTMKLNSPKWRADITSGRWSCNFMKCNADNLLFKFLWNALIEYWNIKDEVVDYFLTDHIIALAYDNLPQVRYMIDGVQPSQPQVFTLLGILNKEYREEIYNEITSDTQAFKLSYKVDIKKENLVGKETFYGHISKMYYSL